MSRKDRKFLHGLTVVVWKKKARAQCVCGKQSPIFKDTEEVMDGQTIVVPKEEHAHEWFLGHTGLVERNRKEPPHEEH